MSFFQSEIVRNEVLEMKQIHEILSVYANQYQSLDSDERIELLNRILNLIEKQRIFYFRLTLSDSDDAKEILGRIQNKMIENGWLESVPALLDLLEKKVNDHLQKEMT
jgi:hypothetical protein